jgi:hypothetical protein
MKRNLSVLFNFDHVIFEKDTCEIFHNKSKIKKGGLYEI